MLLNLVMKSFNQVLFVLEATGNILAASVYSCTYCVGYRCSTWFFKILYWQLLEAHTWAAVFVLLCCNCSTWCRSALYCEEAAAYPFCMKLWNFCVLSRYEPYDALWWWPASLRGVVTAWTTSQLVLPHTSWRSSIFLWWFIRHVTGLWTVPTVYYRNITLKISKQWSTDVSLEKI